MRAKASSTHRQSFRLGRGGVGAGGVEQHGGHGQQLMMIWGNLRAGRELHEMVLSRWELVAAEHSKDGDEKGAGTKLLDVLKQADAVGVVVIVSRWFGGTNLGKARFSYMVKAGCSVLAKVGYTNEAIGDGASEQHARTVSEAHLAQGMLSGFLGHAILHHAEAMVPARQDGVLNTVRQIPSYRRTVRSFFEC